MSIDRDSPVPIYHQLKLLIQERIESGAWRPGECIPTEEELCQTYGISRSPVRQALNELAREGILVRRPGAGTFVSEHFIPLPSPEIPIRVMVTEHYWTQVCDQISRTWNEQHPDQQVIFAPEVVEHRHFYNHLSAAVGNGTAPDIALVDCAWVAGLARAGFIYALEELNTGWNVEECTRNISPPVVEVNTFKGRLYGLPAEADVSLLWYRKDWFAQENLAPPQDWDGLLGVIRHFQQPEVRKRHGSSYGIAFPGGRAGGEATVYTLLPFIWSAGGDIFDGDSVTLDSPATRRALQFLRDLVAVHRASPPEIVDYRETSAVTALIGGKTAMALGGSYEGLVIRETGGWDSEQILQRVGCVPPPSAPGGRSYSTLGGTSYVILRQCQRPKLMLELITSTIASPSIGDAYRSILHYLPHPSFEASLDPQNDPFLTSTSSLMAYARARPPVPEYFWVSRQLQAMFEAIMSESTPVGEIIWRTAEFIGAISGKPVSHTVPTETR